MIFLNLGIIISLLAGLSTMLGVIPIFLKVKDIDKLIVISLSFSSGVLLFISIFDLFPESINLFNFSHEKYVSIMLFIIMFFIGIYLTKLINDNSYEGNNLYKIGLVSMIAIIMHNIPEGILTFFMTNINQKLGITMGLAIAMHNIPEGITISLPIYYSTNNKLKAIKYTFISSISEPLGAIISSLFFKGSINYTILGLLFSLVSGIMIYISIFELLKESFKYKKVLLLIISFLIGILFSLIVFKIK